MNRRTPHMLRPAHAALAAGVAAALAPAAAAQIEIDWHTIDGGGHMFSTRDGIELSGTFAQADAAYHGDKTLGIIGGFWSIDAVTFPCYADCDTSSGVNVLDVFDFLCFQNAYAARDPYACDCDQNSGPGVCDIFDFLCFQNAYIVGCP